MTFQQVMELFLQLLPKTITGEATWEHLDGFDMVRIGSGGRLIRIGRSPGPNDEPAPDAEITYPIWVIGPRGGVSDEYEVTPRAPREYELVSQLFAEAKKRAIDSNTYAQMLIDALNEKSLFAPATSTR